MPLPASIEISPAQAKSDKLPGLFPPGTQVYLTDTGNVRDAEMVAAARRLTDLGYRPVPHFAARRLSTKAALANRVQQLAEQAGVVDVLVIGGGLERPAGDFAASIEVLETGAFDAAGIKAIGIAGHPEGSPDFGLNAALEALRLKQAFGERSDAEMRIVTQFGFAPQAFVQWAAGLAAQGIHLPVHLGVAGPAKLPTLLKFAAMCGIGNSIRYLKQRANVVSQLASGFDPESITGPIEAELAKQPDAPIQQLHVFPFGGMEKAAVWLQKRGSWA